MSPLSQPWGSRDEDPGSIVASLPSSTWAPGPLRACVDDDDGVDDDDDDDGDEDGDEDDDGDDVIEEDTWCWLTFAHIYNAFSV